MWDYYKKTFLAVQLFSAVVSTMVYRASHSLAPAAVFLLSMEASAFLGAMWASRLRRKMQSRTSCLIN